jgi:hypothetical protein
LKNIADFNWKTYGIKNDAICCFCKKTFTDNNAPNLLCFPEKGKTKIFIAHKFCLQINSETDGGLDVKKFKTKQYETFKGEQK